MDKEERKHPSHKTRFSDSSLYDEVCIHCGATDLTPGGWGKLAEPCPDSILTAKQATKLMLDRFPKDVWKKR